MRRLFTLIARFRQAPRSQYSRNKQVCLLVTRPVLYLGYSQEALQHAIDDVQAILQAQGLLQKLSGRFDEDTKKAVEAFQQQNNLYVDGIVGPITWAALYYPRLSRCDAATPEQQEKVKELQKLLYEEGFLLFPSGDFGRRTERALKQFQRIYGLRPDGVCGAMTWAVLLGQREKADPKPPVGFYLLSRNDLFFIEQLLMIGAIYMGICFNPLGQKPSVPETLVTAYGLTYVVPPLLERLGVKQALQRNVPLLQFAPYTLVGFLWRPILEGLKTVLH